MNVWDFAKRYLYPYKVKGDEITATYCPICKGGNNHDKNTFSINSNKLTFHCLRGSCGASGHFKQLCDQFGEKYESPDYETNFQKKGIQETECQDK